MLTRTNLIQERILREVEFYKKGKWHKTHAYVTQEQICARAGCSRFVTGNQRAVSRRHGFARHFCSVECASKQIAFEQICRRLEDTQ